MVISCRKVLIVIVLAIDTRQRNKLFIAICLIRFVVNLHVETQLVQILFAYMIWLKFYFTKHNDFIDFQKLSKQAGG